jgi:Helicase HerA, central domain
MAESLYLGREHFPKATKPGDRVELDPADLVTHGLIVGMTGSGKTGLAVVLIEEVLRSGIPVLAIDPKGDLGNLLLLFDDFAPASFEPWIDPEAARREGKDVKTKAAETALMWEKGLRSWGLSGENMRELAAAREAVIFTPGFEGGRPLNVLQSLEAPSVAFDSAAEDLRDEISGLVSGLLGLLHIDADPLQSRESIFLSNLIEHSWRAGKGQSLEALVTGVADPPFDMLGALPLETAFPRKERQGLMMALNNLLASPSFAAWRKGEPLDVDRLLRASDGRPRLSIVYTAHLSDEERLFVTALLLDKVKTWMRRQGGTSELRALLYMDEIYGYFPPHPDNPPTKRPLLTLLKQARAQGVGVVLATQNPVDLDYKGLANMGTWLVGKLQTSRDRERLRAGLEGTGGLDAKTIDTLLDATAKRVFLLHDVHRKAPCLLESRWAMSYLRGPLTKDEVARLTKAGQGGGEAAVAARGAPPTKAGAGPPVLPASYRARYYAREGGALAEAHLLVKYAVRYKGSGEIVAVRAWPLAGDSAAEVFEGRPFEVEEARLETEPRGELRYGSLPGFFAGAAAEKALDKALGDRLPDKLAVRLFYDPETRTTSSPGETLDDFAQRLQGDGGGVAAEKLRERLAKRQRDLTRREQEVAGRKQEKWLAVGTAVLQNIGILTGRKRTISGVGTAISKNRMEDDAEGRAAALREEIAELQGKLRALTEVDPGRFQEKDLVPTASDVEVLRHDLLWVY